MHTSKVLRATDFKYWRLHEGDAVQTDLRNFSPGYHVQDRIAIVSPSLEDGVLNAGYAILALTTAFYGVMRARGEDFYDYPQHFALLGADEEGINTGAGRLPIDDETIGAVWGGLDVWPDSNWIPARETVSGMLRKVFDLQINRLFWPENLATDEDQSTFPIYVRKLLKARLKTVYYYNTATPNVEIRVTQPAEDTVQKSIARLPAIEGSEAPLRVTQPANDGLFCAERFRQVSAGEFLQDPRFASMWAD
jgi:hypothetical protein